MHKINSLTFLSAVETFLRYVQRNFNVHNHLVERRLGSGQGINLRDHLIYLVTDLRLPVLDVADAVTQPAANVVLCSVGLVVGLATQTGGVQTDPLGARARLVGRHVVDDVR